MAELLAVLRVSSHAGLLFRVSSRKSLSFVLVRQRGCLTHALRQLQYQLLRISGVYNTTLRTTPSIWTF